MENDVHDKEELFEDVLEKLKSNALSKSDYDCINDIFECI